MAISVFKDIEVKGIAASVPKKKIMNLVDHTFCSENERKKIVNLTGVSEYRKTSPEVCASDLCEKAARRLIDDLALDPMSIEAVVFATMTPDYRIPSTACVLQDKLRLSRSTVAYDINMGCSGYVVGLYNACSIIQGAGLKRVLLLAGDTQSKLSYEKDKNVVFLLGDAGTASLVEASRGSEDITIEIETDGSRFDKLFVPAGGFRKPSTEQTREVREQPDGGFRSEEHMYMDGMEIFKFSSTDVVKSLSSFMENQGVTAEDVDFLVLHQANKFMNDKIGRKLKFPMEKLPYSIEKYGNTASASIPLTIVHSYGEVIPKGKIRCLLSGFGVGLSWGIVDINLEEIHCPPVIEY